MREKRANVVPLFSEVVPTLPAELPIDVSHLRSRLPAEAALSSSRLDLAGKRKALLVVGSGGTGKSLFLRWACDRALMSEKGEDRPLSLASVDVLNRELVHYFEGVHTPNTPDTRTWLGFYLSWLIKEQGEAAPSAAIDFGGGDTALAGLADEVGDLAGQFTGAGVEPVLVVLLSPRVTDLSALEALNQAGFQPRATMLVINTGLATVGLDPWRAFSTLRAHSVYQAAVARGAAEVWMPRCFAARAVEEHRLGFIAASEADGVIGIFDRGRILAWLSNMETAFGGVASWLP